MKYCKYVNIKQGSASTHRFSNGNTLPLIQLPFGMTAFAPQTSDGNLRWYYHPKDRSLEGIRLTHQPSPWIADYGAVCFLPQINPLNVGGEERWSGFRPEDTVLSPCYLKYDLLRSRSRIELSPTERCAKIRVTFNNDNDRFFSCLPVTGKYTYRYNEKKNSVYLTADNCSGGDHHNFCEYVVVRFPEGSVVKTFTQKENKNAREGISVTGNDTAIHVQLKDSVTEIAIGVSYLSFSQAEYSIDREIGDKSFDTIKNEAEAIWEEYLGRVKITPKDNKQMKTFSSCMYRAFLYPHRCSEIAPDGKEYHYSPFDGKKYEGVRFTDNGFWDTYRTVYPFFSLVAKEELRLMIHSFINDYRECGWLPRWISIGECGCMPSTLIDAVICDAAVKGFIEKEDLETALEGMIKHATKESAFPRYGRNGAKAYCKLGYVPYDLQKESVNLTQDAAYGDWCIAEIAKLLGKKDIEAEYRKRAKNYKNLFDKKTGFMRPKDTNGKFRKDFTPDGWGRDYTEGSAWQNSFAVPHDMKGLAKLYGGKDKLIAKIDELFATKPDYTIIGYSCEIHEITEMAAADFGQCAISNQPSFHIPYIYSELGDVEKSAYWVEKLCNEAFSYKDDGFPGDEDNGSMALWYIFGILGFYPFCPGKKEFVKGKKQVIKAEILGKEIDVDKFEGNKIPYESLI